MSDNTTKGVNQDFLNKLEKDGVLTSKEISFNKAKNRFNLSTVDLTNKKVKTLEDVEKELICSKYLPFRRNLMNNISAEGGVGKTTLCLILIIIYLLEEKYDYKRESRALFWASEDTSDDITSRFHMICDELLKISENDKKYVIEHFLIIDLNTEIPVFLDGEKFKKKKTEDYDAFLELIEPFNLIILDPLLAFYSACDLNENDNSEAKKFMMLFSTITQKMKKTFIMLSHTSKHENGTRGASAFRDAFRYSVYISKYKFKQTDAEGNVIKDIKTGEVLYRDDESKSNLREVRIIKDNSNVSTFIKANRPFYRFCYEENYQIFDIELFPKSSKEESERILSIKDGSFITDIQKRNANEYLEFSEF